MRVFIAEASNANDFYQETLDGKSVQNLLNTIGVENQFRMVLSPRNLQKAIKEASAGCYDIFHLSCHGDDDGIVVVDDRLNWSDFAQRFRRIKGDPPALVMSSCCGATSGIRRAFENSGAHPHVHLRLYGGARLQRVLCCMGYPLPSVQQRWCL
jgi:hypothetical protein